MSRGWQGVGHLTLQLCSSAASDPVRALSGDPVEVQQQIHGERASASVGRTAFAGLVFLTRLEVQPQQTDGVPPHTAAGLYFLFCSSL